MPLAWTSLQATERSVLKLVTFLAQKKASPKSKFLQLFSPSSSLEAGAAEITAESVTFLFCFLKEYF